MQSRSRRAAISLYHYGGESSNIYKTSNEELCTTSRLITAAPSGCTRGRAYLSLIVCRCPQMRRHAPHWSRPLHTSLRPALYAAMAFSCKSPALFDALAAYQVPGPRPAGPLRSADVWGRGSFCMICMAAWDPTRVGGVLCGPFSIATSCEACDQVARRPGRLRGCGCLSPGATAGTVESAWQQLMGLQWQAAGPNLLADNFWGCIPKAAAHLLQI